MRNRAGTLLVAGQTLFKVPPILLDTSDVGLEAVTVRSMGCEVVRHRLQPLVFHGQRLFFGQQGETFGFKFRVGQDVFPCRNGASPTAQARFQTDPRPNRGVVSQFD